MHIKLYKYFQQHRKLFSLFLFQSDNGFHYLIKQLDVIFDKFLIEGQNNSTRLQRA